jgi:hypothetical protein
MHVCSRAAGLAQRTLQEQAQKYFVLLIITDGDITDLEATKAAIVDATDLPLSIIIVGVGSAEFVSMRILDSDQGPLRAGQKEAKRDIVQVRAPSSACACWWVRMCHCKVR